MPESRFPLIEIDADFLRHWPIAMPEGDKESHGRVLIIGGSAEMPGAVLLAANAALRAGAGKVTIATGRSVALAVAIAVPEARVIGLAETADGAFIADGLHALDKTLDRIDAVLVGPGMVGKAETCDLVRELLQRLTSSKLVLDAAAMDVAIEDGADWNGNDVLFTPHAGEMAHLTPHDRDTVEADALQIARGAARRWRATVALKGPVTHVVEPEGKTWRHEGGNVGLGVSGSGDTLAGIIVGLAARGASLSQAACWGVALHARAGDALAAEFGTLGYLARDLAAKVPALIHSIER
ncbi:MAG: NAD(P)H-hydrate dehydratase [Rhizobacter sp.]|nr:NAD(P)H-hydrate dehydratase [Rhizobacter sp.]